MTRKQDRTHREHDVHRRPGERYDDLRRCAGGAAARCSQALVSPIRTADIQTSTSSAGTMSVPNKDTCTSGFKESRFARLAVSSPNASATQPWVTSWRMIEGMIARK